MNRDLEYHIPTYNELRAIINNNKNKFITFDELIEPIVPNGKIGQINQQSYGECYIDASAIALSENQYGQNLLSRSIKMSPGEDGYIVTFYGEKNKTGKPKTYYITNKELKDAQEQNIKNNTVKEGENIKNIHQVMPI